MPAKIVPGRNALRSINGRKAAFGRKPSQVHSQRFFVLRGDQEQNFWFFGSWPRTKNRSSLWNEEQVFFEERRTTQRSTSLFCTYEPATCNPQPRSHNSSLDQFHSRVPEFLYSSLNIALASFNPFCSVYYYIYLEAGHESIVNSVFEAVIKSQPANV